MKTFLSVSAGKLRVEHLEEVTMFDTAKAAAGWLYAKGITEWMESSSMHYGKEDGWHLDDVGEEVGTALAALTRPAIDEENAIIAEALNARANVIRAEANRTARITGKSDAPEVKELWAMARKVDALAKRFAK